MSKLCIVRKVNTHEESNLYFPAMKVRTAYIMQCLGTYALPTYPRVNRGRLPVVVVVDRREFFFLKPQQLHGEVKPHWLRSDLAVTNSHHATPHLPLTNWVSSG
jgi:hypothetical protein